MLKAIGDGAGINTNAVSTRFFKPSLVETRKMHRQEKYGQMNVSVQACLLDLLRELVRGMKLIAIILPHNLAVLRLLADRLIVMKNEYFMVPGLRSKFQMIRNTPIPSFSFPLFCRF